MEGRKQRMVVSQTLTREALRRRLWSVANRGDIGSVNGAVLLETLNRRDIFGIGRAWN
jgi:hypothetical protein